MQFREVFVTNAGQAMLARATAKKERITWGTSKTIGVNTINTQTEETIRGWDNLPGEYTLNSCTGQVTSSVANGNKITLHSELTNGASGTNIYGLAIYAKLEDGEEKLAIVARTAGADASYIGARGNVVKLFIDIAVNLTDFVATAVTVDASNYAQAGALAATNEALEDICSRVVTTHRAGDEETGEAQVVRGMKSFSSPIVANNGIMTPAGILAGDETGIAQLDKTGIFFRESDVADAKTSLSASDGLKVQKAEVLRIKNAKAECGKIFPTNEGTDIVITAINETSPYTNTVEILSGITDESESAIREVLLMFETTGSLTLTNDPKKEAYTPPGVIGGSVSAITLNCTIPEAKSAIGTSGTRFTYTVQNNTTLGNATRRFGALYADKINGSLNMATGILASLYGNDKGALLEITITGALNATQSRATNGVLPRGTIIRNGHNYDASGAEDSDTYVVPPLLAVTITCESMSITDNMRFVLLKKTEIYIPANTLSATVTAWAIRVE